MIKLKQIYGFISRCKDFKNKVRVIACILNSIALLPAFIFHELMHFIIAMPFGTNVEITEFYLFEAEENSLKTFKMAISYNAKPDIGILGSVAPLLGWIISVILLITNSHWIILAYFIFAFRIFFLSDQDIICMHENGCNQTICELLYEINDFVIKNVPMNKMSQTWN